ncbi:MAG TPA: hypothetical protein VMF61_02875 [Candidatus Acidoferrales bacterium]|nr:hypothetical protein [Candidatus Acidoferrales bacterium]
MDSTNSASVAALGAIVMVYFAIVVAIVALSIWFYWRIFAKAGYNGAMSLLNLIPGVGPLICILILAFGRWPIEDALAAAGGRLVPPGSVPPGAMPPAPPGSTLAQP